MQTQDVFISLLRETGAMLEGHFRLTSGRHSDQYIQCARLFEHPEQSERLCRELAARFCGSVDIVIGPALGGMIMAYEVARALRVRNIFTERQDGVMTFRRGFALQPGERALIVEDVVTTGGSVLEVISLAKEAGAQVAGVGAIVDRSAGKVNFGVPFECLVSMDVLSYAPEACPLCEKNLPIVKPGSRNTKQ